MSNEQEYSYPNPEEWKKMLAQTTQSNNGNPQYYLPNKNGWGRIFGDVEMDQTDPEVEKEVSKSATEEKKSLARFQSPMAGILHRSLKNKIKPAQRYEVEFKVSTNSRTGFFAATLTYTNESGTPIGLPSSTGIPLNTLVPGSDTPISFVTLPAPGDAVKAQLAFVVFGVESNKSVDLEKVSVKKIS